jgi:hypothetical protein
MSKIRNINGSGDGILGAYAGPVETGRGGSRKSPDSFSGASPPASPSLTVFSSLKTQTSGVLNGGITVPVIPAAVKKPNRFNACARAIFAAAVCLCVLFWSCKNDPYTPEPQPPAVNEITSTSLGDPDANGEYTVSHSNKITLGGNTGAADKTYVWTYTTDPANAAKNLSFDPNTNTASPEVGGFAKNVKYTFTLTVTDKATGLTAAKSITIKVPANEGPSVSIGEDYKNINETLSGSLTVTLNATVTDADDDDNTITRAWTCESYTYDEYAISDPYSADDVTELIQNAGENTATVALRKAGTYVFQLTATDSGNISAHNTMTVTVAPIVVGAKKVSVSFADFGEEPTVIDLNPIYAPEDGWGYHSAGDIKYTIFSKHTTGDTTYEKDFTSLGSIDIVRDKSLYGSLWPWLPPLFTQTFYDNDGNKLGKHSFFAGDRFNDAGYFTHVRADSNGNGVYKSAIDQTISSLPTIVLELPGKTITELPDD